MQMLTPFGQALRVLRVEKRLKLFEMAKDLGMSSAYLSAIEMGRKRIPNDLVKKVARLYDLDLVAEQKLQEEADKSHSTLTIDLKRSGDKTRDLALYLSRRFEGDMDEAKAAKILDALSALEKESGGRGR